MAKKNYDSIRDDYKTPPSIYQTILDFIGENAFYIDVCCTEKNIPAYNYFTKEGWYCFENSHFTPNGKQNDIDGLGMDWESLCFMNPPFRTCRKWVEKAVKEVEKNSCEVWAVLPTNRCENLFYQDCIFNNKNCTFAFLPRKQGFIIPGEENTPPVPSQGIMIVCFTKAPLEIAEKWNNKHGEMPFNTKMFSGGFNDPIEYCEPMNITIKA